MVPVPESGTGTMMQWASDTGTTQTHTGSEGLVPVPVKVVAVPLLPAALFVLICFTIKSRIRIPMVKDPKKLLMGVQIRI